MAKKRARLTVDDIHGAWAIVPTPAKPGAEDWRQEDTVDYDEAARVVEGLIAAGVDGILSLGTLGECATLTWAEKRKLMATMVEAARGRVPVFGGTTSLNTRESVRQTREVADIGIDGTMLGIPMWCTPSVEVAVQFYRDIAEGCPEMAIAVYANPQAFKFDFPRPFWAEVSKIPQVVTAKYIGIGQILLDQQLSGNRIRFLPIDIDYYAAARLDPDFFTAFWSSGAVCGPSVSIRLRDEVMRAKKTGDWSAAKSLNDAINHSVVSLFPQGSFAEFSKFNIGLEKARMDAGGWMKAGAIRPPYHLVPEPYLEGARKSGRMWAELAAKFSRDAAAA